MHSGIGPANAARIARVKGLQTVETTMLYAVMKDRALYKDTLAKYCLPKEQYCSQPDHTLADWVDAWAQISKAWAEYAEQQTTLATKAEGPDATSFYKTVEEPILQSRGVRITVDNQYKAGRRRKRMLAGYMSRVKILQGSLVTSRAQALMQGIRLGVGW